MQLSEPGPITAHSLLRAAVFIKDRRLTRCMTPGAIPTVKSFGILTEYAPYRLQVGATTPWSNTQVYVCGESVVNKLMYGGGSLDLITSMGTWICHTVFGTAIP